MNNEPSLLDYLKSILDPRQERIRLDSVRDDGRSQDSVMQAPTDVSLPTLLPEADAADEADVAAEPIEAGFAPVVRGPLPWRSLAAVLLAIFAQGALAPPDRLVTMGIVLYLAAFVMGGWALISGDLGFSKLRDVQYRTDEYGIQRRPLLVSLPLVFVAFLLLGGNHFSSLNLFVWLSALGFLCFGLAERRGRTFSIRKIIEKNSPPYTLRITPWMLMLAVGTVIVLFFRFYRLDTVPLQMFSDHAEKLQDVQDVLNGETRIFFPRNTGREFVQMYLTAFTAKYLGYNLTFMALKMGTALAGLVTLPFIYLLGKELANRRVGLLAMVMAGMSYWLNVITRVALRFSMYPLFVAPTLYFVVRGLRRGSRNDFIWAGVFLGLGLHGYSPFRFVPVLVVLAVVLFIFHVRTDRKRMQGLWHLGIVIAVSLVVFLPLLRFMSESPENSSLVLYRSLTRLTSIESPYPDNPIRVFSENMWRSMTMFAWENGNTWVHSVVFRPALDILTGGLFYLGYILVLIRYVRHRNWEDLLLVLSVPFLMLPSALSLAFPAENPSLNRSGGAIIPVFLMAALSLDGLMTSVRRWIGPQWGVIAAWSLAGVLLSWSALANYDLVFHQYNEQFRQNAWNTTELGAVIRGFADSVGGEDNAWVVPWPHWVDTRLVGINAGVYIRDYAIQRENLDQTLAFQGPKLFLLNLQDAETRDRLFELYPQGGLREFQSEFPGKNFLIFYTYVP